MQIGHAHLKVRDIDRAITFYERYLGQHVTERIGNDYVFMTGTAMHHEIALQNVGSAAPAPDPQGTGLYHVAFEAASKREFATAFQTLRDGGISVATVDHFISWAMYFDDPDGNGLEIYWDTRSEPGGQQIWHGRNAALPPTKILAALAEA